MTSKDELNAAGDKIVNAILSVQDDVVGGAEGFRDELIELYVGWVGEKQAFINDQLEANPLDDSAWGRAVDEADHLQEQLVRRIRGARSELMAAQNNARANRELLKAVYSVGGGRRDPEKDKSRLDSLEETERAYEKCVRAVLEVEGFLASSDELGKE